MKWIKEEVCYLIRNYGDIPTTQIAKEMNRSVVSIHCKAQELGLNKNTSKYLQVHKDLITIRGDVFDQWNVSEFVVDYYKKKR